MKRQYKVVSIRHLFYFFLIFSSIVTVVARTIFYYFFKCVLEKTKELKRSEKQRKKRN